MHMRSAYCAILLGFRDGCHTGQGSTMKLPCACCSVIVVVPGHSARV